MRGFVTYGNPAILARKSTKRYHKNKYFENSAVREIHNMINNLSNLYISRHFLIRNQMKVVIPSKKNIMKGDIFEYYRDSRGNILKFCVRCQDMSSKNDHVYIISNDGCIVTGWVNSKNDWHSTVNMDLYEEG